MFFGTMVVKYSELYMDILDSSTSLGNRPGWRAEVPVTLQVDPSYSLFGTFWYQYSAIGQSEQFEVVRKDGTVAGGAYEPDSSTHQYGAILGVSARL